MVAVIASMASSTRISESFRPEIGGTVPKSGRRSISATSLAWLSRRRRKSQPIDQPAPDAKFRRQSRE